MDTAFLRVVDHRPWPLSPVPWRMEMVWHDLLFAHWPVAAAALRPLISPDVEIETYDGRAWIGIVPFRMTGIRHRMLPTLPGLSAFPEINVRTYVRCGGRAGVWFLSLDASCAMAVRVARFAYCLPYHRADIRCERRGDAIEYASRRLERGGGGAEFAATYRPVGPVHAARSGTLEHWLTERYCLFAGARNGGVHVAEIHHVPWPLQAAECSIERNTMCGPLGISLPEMRPVLHFARRVDAVAWGLKRVGEGKTSDQATERCSHEATQPRSHGAMEGWSEAAGGRRGPGNGFETQKR